MTPDDVERLALQADPFREHGRLAQYAMGCPDEMAGFVAMVIELCAKECDRLSAALDNGGNEYRREATASQCSAAIRRMKPNADRNRRA